MMGCEESFKMWSSPADGLLGIFIVDCPLLVVPLAF